MFKLALLSLAHKSIIGAKPIYFQNIFKYSHHGHVIRLLTPCANTRYFVKDSFSFAAPRIYN